MADGRKMNEEIYKKIAKESGVCVGAVKKDIQEAINAAFIAPNAEAQNIPCKGSIPTLDEVIAYIESKLSRQ